MSLQNITSQEIVGCLFKGMFLSKYVFCIHPAAIDPVVPFPILDMKPEPKRSVLKKLKCYKKYDFYFGYVIPSKSLFQIARMISHHVCILLAFLSEPLAGPRVLLSARGRQDGPSGRAVQLRAWSGK